jgi:DNA-binding transcriptional regulator YhcF (GntR family)
MRDKNYSTGLRGVLFEAQHYARMGAAVWLYAWLVLRETHESGSLGWVLGGKPVSYREIEEETGFNPRTLERWMRTLRRQGYIETDAAAGGVVIRITKAKKFRQSSGFPQGARKAAEGVRKTAGAVTQSCVADTRDQPSNQQAGTRIGSSSVEREKERTTATSFGLEEKQENCASQHQHRNLQASNHQYPNHTHRIDFDTRAQPGTHASNDYTRRSLLRAERDDALRRELAVGTGPEVRRS